MGQDFYFWEPTKTAAALTSVHATTAPRKGGARNQGGLASVTAFAARPMGRTFRGATIHTPATAIT